MSANEQMFSEFTDSKASAEAYKESLGKTIANVTIVDHELLFRFTDGTKLILRDDGQACCVTRYMDSDDDFEPFQGATLTSVEVRDGGVVSDEDDCEQHESQFMIVTTSEGSFTVVNHNENHGYYTGFELTAMKG